MMPKCLRAVEQYNQKTRDAWGHSRRRVKASTNTERGLLLYLSASIWKVC